MQEEQEFKRTIELSQKETVQVQEQQIALEKVCLACF